jgi:transcriptional regulator with XRE-family HTH domain
MTISERIIKVRNDAGLSQVEFAKQLSLSKQTVSNYETGARQPGLDIILKISDEFNVSTDYLLGKSDYKNLTAQELFNSNSNILSIKTKNKLSGFSKKDLELLNRLLLSGAFDKLISTLSRYDNLSNIDIMQYCYLIYGEDSPLAKLKSHLDRDTFKKKMLKGDFDEAVNDLLKMLDKFYKVDNLQEDEE